MLDPGAFNSMINDMGQNVLWRQAFDCPCRDVRSGAPDPDCPSCRGVGIIWATGVSARVAIAGQKIQQQWAQMGMYESGDQVTTIPTDSAVFAMGQNDRLTMVHSSVPFSVVVPPDHVFSEPVIAVVRAMVITNGAAVTIDSPVIGANGVMVWEDGAPDVPFVSITGRAKPEYFAFQDYPQERAHFGGTLFPRRVVLRKFDLFGR